MIRTFVKDTTSSYKELIQVNEETQVIKMYAQDNEFGFPFDESYTTINDDYWFSCWDSLEQFIKAQEENCQFEVDTDLQVKSEIAGLLNFRKHQIDNNTYRKLALNDGSVLDSTLDSLEKHYNYTKEEATKLVQFSDFVDDLKKKYDVSWEQHLKEAESIFSVQEKDAFLKLIKTNIPEELLEEYCYQGKSR